MKELERARWRCRRGMLELDIVLQRFMDQYYRQLSKDEISQLESLLSFADNDLWDLICERKATMDEGLLPVLKLLRY